MKHVLILVLMINYEQMELISEEYPSKVVCEQEIERITKDVEDLNKFTYPINIVSITCVKGELHE